MSTSDKLNYLIETKNAIKTAIQNKGVSVTNEDTFRNYAEKISSIPQTVKADDWKPEADWWNIEEILENDTEDYEAKVILLLTDELDNTGILQEIKGFSKYKLSDGQVFTPQNYTQTVNITDIFDTTKDKECSKRYKTRYIIGYFNSQSSTTMFFPANTLAIIIDGIKSGNNTCFQNKQYLQYVKFKNLILPSASLNSMFIHDVRLQKVEGLENISNMNNENFISYNSMFSDNTSLKKAPYLEISDDSTVISMFYGCVSLIDISNVNMGENISNITSIISYTQVEDFPFDFSSGTLTNVVQAFYMSPKLKKIGKLNLEKVTDTSKASSIFGNCYSLEEIEDITNISVSLNFSNCNLLTRSTLLKILNGLVDLTGKSAQTLTLGATNLAKLTDEEKAIATNKNWILK